MRSKIWIKINKDNQCAGLLMQVLRSYNVTAVKDAKRGC